MTTPARRVGIREVAQAAGVSVTTVSHSLNGKGRLPEETREHVRQVAARLGYRPNSTARNLAGGRTGLLGLAVSQAEGLPFALSDFEYFVQLMTATTTAATDRGYALVLGPANRGADTWASIDVDGAIIVDPVVDDPMVAELTANGVPVVTSGRQPGATTDGHWVDNDHGAGTRTVLDHLERAGARRIALVTSPPVTSYGRDVEEAYGAWCAARGTEPLVAYGRDDLTEGAGFEAASELLALPEPPDAIYATLDRLAIGTLLAAAERGVPVPGELLVAGSTDSEASRWARPSLTALNLHPQRIGELAVDLLVRLVEGRPPSQPHLFVPTRLIPRGSTRRRPPRAQS
jgi:DNA-binding LacI/PurR family transcriptional regulator